MPARRKYHNLPLVKTCPVCECEFPRPENYGHDRWFKAELCSLSCASRRGSDARRAKQQPLEEAFRERVDTTPGHGPEGECHVWTGSRDTLGYGRIKRQGKAIKATHLALRFAGRPLPDGMMACHECDYPPCVREDHLFHGSGADNQADRAQKRRGPREESHHKARLTVASVLAIRADVRPYADIAATYGITIHNVSAIRTRKTWRDV